MELSGRVVQEKTDRIEQMQKQIESMQEQREAERRQVNEEGRMLVKQLTDDIKALSRENSGYAFKVKEQQ